MANSPPTPAEIDAFVQHVIGWSQTLQRAADVAVQKAQAQRASGAVSFVALNRTLQDKITLTEHCSRMVASASSVLLTVARSELAPLEQATERLAAASERLDAVTDGVELASRLVVAGAAVAAALAAPAVGTIGAAAGALVKVVQGAGDASGE
ncbi:MAG TPA: hypothetical protein VGK73_23905 [Polyangiaceae bacterium]